MIAWFSSSYRSYMLSFHFECQILVLDKKEDVPKIIRDKNTNGVVETGILCNTWKVNIILLMVHRYLLRLTFLLENIVGILGFPRTLHQTVNFYGRKVDSTLYVSKKRFATRLLPTVSWDSTFYVSLKRFITPSSQPLICTAKSSSLFKSTFYNTYDHQKIRKDVIIGYVSEFNKWPLH